MLYGSLFGTPPSLRFVRLYLDAHRDLAWLTEAGDDEIRTLSVITARRLNAAAVEPWLRSRQRNHLLTRKLLLIAYLAETDGAHRSRFASATRHRPALALVRLGLAGAQAFVRLGAGYLLKRRHALV